MRCQVAADHLPASWLFIYCAVSVHHRACRGDGPVLPGPASGGTGQRGAHIHELLQDPLPHPLLLGPVADAGTITQQEFTG